MHLLPKSKRAKRIIFAFTTLVRAVSVFICSNRFREDLQQYGNMATTTLLTPPSDTIEITNAGLRALETIYQSGIMYKKSGVIVSDICDANTAQATT